MNLHYTLHSGKNSKINYYARNYLRLATPKALLRHRLPALLEQAAQRDDSHPPRPSTCNSGTNTLSCSPTSP